MTPKLRAFIKGLPRCNPHLVVKYEKPERFFGQVRTFWNLRFELSGGYVTIWEDVLLLVVQDQLQPPLYAYRSDDRKDRWGALDWTRFRDAIELMGLVWPAECEQLVG